MKTTTLIKSDEQALLSAESVFSLYSKFCHYKSTIVASVSLVFRQEEEMRNVEHDRSVSGWTLQLLFFFSTLLLK